MSTYRALQIGPVVVLILAGIAWAGPDIDEDDYGDAGSLPMSALTVSGAGALNSIKGKLTGGGPGPTGVPDFEDMYLIQIADPVAFSATAEGGPLFPFNTQLWLFDSTGRGLLANDDSPGGTGGSQLLPASNDGTGVVINTPGLYFIAITGFNNDPTANELPIFDQATPQEISGPDGPGGMNPITGWTGPPAEVGDYVITFTGVEFVPPPVPTTSQWGVVVMGLLITVAATIVFARRLRAVRA